MTLPKYFANSIPSYLQLYSPFASQHNSFACESKEDENISTLKSSVSLSKLLKHFPFKPKESCRHNAIKSIYNRIRLRKKRKKKFPRLIVAHSKIYEKHNLRNENQPRENVKYTQYWMNSMRGDFRVPGRQTNCWRDGREATKNFEKKKNVIMVSTDNASTGNNRRITSAEPRIFCF